LTDVAHFPYTASCSRPPPAARDGPQLPKGQRGSVFVVSGGSPPGDPQERGWRRNASDRYRVFLIDPAWPETVQNCLLPTPPLPFATNFMGCVCSALDCQRPEVIRRVGTSLAKAMPLPGLLIRRTGNRYDLLHASHENHRKGFRSGSRWSPFFELSGASPFQGIEFFQIFRRAATRAAAPLSQPRRLRAARLRWRCFPTVSTFRRG
jgi:hypothetical protein